MCECTRKHRLQQNWNSPPRRCAIRGCPSHARPYTVEGIEFHSLKLIEAMTAVDEGKVLTKRLGAGQVRRPYGRVDKISRAPAASNNGMK